MMDVLVQKSLSLNENVNLNLFKFRLPTSSVREVPMFKLDFELNDSHIEKSLVVLNFNNELNEQTDKIFLEKQYHLNSDGTCQFENEEFGDYFIDGEFKILDFNPELNERLCFLRMNYGNKKKELLFIKGHFKLDKK